jgi:hypothetical protein
MSFEVIIGWIIIVFIMHEIQNEYIYFMTLFVIMQSGS